MSSSSSKEFADPSEQDRVKRQRTEPPVMWGWDYSRAYLIHEPHRHQEASPEEKEYCKHRFYAGICAKCGENKDDHDNKSGVALGYVNKNLRLGNDEIPPLRDNDIKNLLGQRKLCLVLDLDHTLLNSARHHDMTLSQRVYLYRTPGAYESFNKLPKIDMVTKLRPYVHTFLEEASKLFDMCIYTLGERGYALEMAKLLDPTGIYFRSKILAQEDCTQMHKKGLDIVLGKEKAVVILDDTEWVWEKHKENLMLIEKYHFFTWSRKAFVSECKSLSEQEKDEEEADGPLASILRALQRVHNLFFDLGPTDNLDDRDVREGCRIAFGRIFPDRFPAEHHELLPKLAEQLGATCSEGPDPSVTHVVSRNSGTFEAYWALKEKKLLVNPKWIEAANCLWKRPPEEKFPVAAES